MAGETCGCVCVRVCLCFCRPYWCICMPYQIWLLREICASALVNRLYKLNIMRCATFTYHLFSGLGLGRDPGPGMNSAVWMHHTSTVLEGTYMAIIHFVLLIASFCEVTKEEHNTWSRCWMLHSAFSGFFKERVWHLCLPYASASMMMARFCDLPLTCIQ